MGRVVAFVSNLLQPTRRLPMIWNGASSFGRQSSAGRGLHRRDRRSAVAMVIRSMDVKRFVLAATVIVLSVPLRRTGRVNLRKRRSSVFPGSTRHSLKTEEAAEFATVLAVVTAVAAAGALLLRTKKAESLRKTLPAVFALSLIAGAAMAKTAHEGGNAIRRFGILLPAPTARHLQRY